MGNENSIENEEHQTTTMADPEKVVDETSKTTEVESESENEPQLEEEEEEDIEEMQDLSPTEAEKDSVNIVDTNIEDKEEENCIEDTNAETSMEESVDTKTEDSSTKTNNSEINSNTNENSFEENIHRIKTLIMARKEKQTEKAQLQLQAEAQHEKQHEAQHEKQAEAQHEEQAEAQAEASQKSEQQPLESTSNTSNTVSDDESSSNSQEENQQLAAKEIETKQGETTRLSVQSPGKDSETQGKLVQTPDNSDSAFTYNTCDVDFTLHLVEQQAHNATEALSSISSETQTEFVQLDLHNNSLGVRWEERPAVQEEIRANPSTSGPSTPTKSGIPNDILKIEDSLNKSFEEAIREFATRNPEGNKLVQMNAANNTKSECPSFVTAGDILDRGFADKTSIRSFVTAPETMRIQEETPIPETSDSQSSTTSNANANTSTADMILDATDTVKGRLWGLIVDGDDLSAPLSSSPAKDALAEASNETNEETNDLALEQQVEPSPELSATISNVKTTTDDNERVSVEAILSHDPSDSSKVEIVIYDQDLLLPEVNLSTGYYFLCCWIDSSSSSSVPLHQRKGHCDTSLCLTESTSNSSTKSTSWLFGSRSKKEQPWYVMPTFDPETDDSSSFCGDNNSERNTSEDDDEGHVISRMAILRELDRLKNSDSSLCYSDRVMEMIHFPMVPRSNEGVVVV